MMRSVLVLYAASAWLADALQPHPKVLEARWQEEKLPPQLRSQALQNPHLRQALQWTSALHKGEEPVYRSPADDVPRSEIFSVLAHAGFIPRHGRRVETPRHQHQHRHHDNGHQQHQTYPHHEQLPYYPGGEDLQRL